MTACWHEPMPPRVSDAGPDIVIYPEPPPDWKELCILASDNAMGAVRTSRDNREHERKLRRGQIEAAMEQLRKALEVLE